MEDRKQPLVIPFTDEELNGTLIDRFAKVRRALPPGHVAYRGPRGEITYEQLFAQAERMAAALAAALGPELRKEQQLVAVLLDADWLELAGMLSVTLAGHYYLAFDPLQGLTHPQAAFREYPIKAVITTRRYAEAARNFAQLTPQEIPVLFADEPIEAPVDFEKPVLTGESYHSIYMTTGSTGQPRPVLCSHTARLHVGFIGSVDFEFSPADHVTLTAPVAMAMSLTTSIGSLMCGASIHRRMDVLASPADMYRWLVEDKITVLNCPAGLLRSLASLPEEYGPIESLRFAGTGGDALYRAEIERLLRFLRPGGIFGIRLGSNEGGFLSITIIRKGDVWQGDKYPPGHMPRHIKMFAVDENRQPLAPGEAGELVVRSRFTALGYYLNPEQTADRFIYFDDGSRERQCYTGDMGYVTADGRVEFQGRRDFRVKIRGYRIEMEAVEIAMRKIPHVREAAVTVQFLPSGNKRLVGFLVVEEGYEVTIAQARAELGKTLLPYMIPTVLQVIDNIPKIGAGKIDRKALPVPEPQRSMLSAPYRAPGSDSEAALAHIWESILGLQPVGVDDNFYELGGDSLLSMLLSMEVEKEFQAPIPPEFYKQPTVANLAAILQNRQVSTGSEQAVEKGTSLPLQQRLGRLTPERVLSLLRRQFEKRMLSRPYEQGLAWLFGWAGNSLAQRMLYSREKKLYKALWQELGYEPAGFEDSFLLALAGNIYSAHQLVDIHRQAENIEISGFARSPHVFWQTFAQIMEQPEAYVGKRLISISGLEHLQAALGLGHGLMILSYHGTMTSFPLIMLPHLLGIPVPLVLSPRISMREEEGPVRATVRDYSTVPTGKQAQYSSEIILQGYRALKNKAVIMAFVDNGYTSRGDWPAEVNGRRYMTRAGWAGLAVRSRAPILPVMASMSKDGQVMVEFLPAFTDLEGPVDVDARVQSYLNQFGVYLTRVIREHPEGLHWRIMRNHLQMPLVEIDKTRAPGNQ